MKLVTAILGLFTATAIHAAPLPNPDAKSNEGLKLSSRIIPVGGGTPCKYPVRRERVPKSKILRVQTLIITIIHYRLAASRIDEQLILQNSVLEV